MVYSETRIVIGGLTHVPVLIFIANFIKGKFVINTEKAKETLKELSNKLDNIEKKADEVYEKVKKKKKDKKKKKKDN